MVLPQPEGPRTETSSPFWMLRLIFFKAYTEPPFGNSKVIETSFIFKPDMNVSINKVCKKRRDKLYVTPKILLNYLAAAAKYVVLTNAS